MSAQRAELIDFAAITHTCRAFVREQGQNGCLSRNAALCAALAALAILIAAAWHSPLAHADGGASARNQTAATAPDDSGATMQDYAQRILRALADRHTNNWVRYWQARADCQVAADAHDAAPLDRVLLTLTAAICAQLEARLGVNPAAHMPRGEERSVGLLLNEPGAAVGYTLFTGHWNHDVFLLDPLGRVAHVWHLDIRVEHAKMLDNGNLMIMTNHPRNMILEVDPRGNALWRYSAHYSHHDFLKMPSGNVLLLVRGLKTRDEAIAAGANPEFVSAGGLEYDYLVEVRPTGANGGEVVWEWSVWDHLVQDFDPSKSNYGAAAERPELIDLNFLLETISERRSDFPRDWLHTNSIDYNPALDQIMLSPRHFSELWIIDRSATMEEARRHSGGNGGMGGDLLYRWGNPRAYGRGDADDQRLFWHHQAHWIPPGLPGAGNILVFNNGKEFSGDERFYSSIDEIAPPVDGYRYRRAEDAAYPPDGLAWTYAAKTPADFYAPIESGTQRLPNGNTLIADAIAGTIFQATPDGRIVWKYVAPLDKRVHLRQGERPQVRKTFPTPYGAPVPFQLNKLYRAYWHPPDHPGLQAMDLTPGAYIEDFPDIYARAYADLAAAVAGDFGDPIARSDFDIYLDYESEDTRRLIYIKRQSCSAEDARSRFFLHLIPVHASDLAADRREHGFASFEFSYAGSEVQTLQDGCIAARRLPLYPIERIRTGQYTGEGSLWRAEFPLGR